MQPTLLGGIVDRTLECVWLAALVAVPALMNVYSERVFEGDKVPFLRALALLALALWGVRRIERGGVTAPRRQPLVFAAVVVVVVTLLANAFSIAPAISFWGSYDRLQGTSTLLAYVTFFFLFVATAGRAQVERLITAALIAALVPSLYALIQVLGFDPIVWGAEVVGRVHSTAGNPIFLGAFLILVIPLSLARVLAAIEDERGGAAAVYLVLLALQAVALALTQSRGPMLALGLGLAVFIGATAVAGGLRPAAHAVGVIAVVVGVTVVCMHAVAMAPREDAAAAMNPGAGTARVRLLIWQGTADLIASEPSRLVLGYGPETFRYVFPPFFPPELARLEENDVTPDRAHNDILDTILNIGLIGLIARLVFIVVLFVVLVRGTLARRTETGSGGLPWAGLLAAVTAHLAEIQVGIPTAATQLYFWMYAAAGVVLSSDSYRRTDSTNDGDTDVVLGFATAQLLAVVLFGLYTPGTDAGEAAPVVVVLLGLTWAAALAIAAASAAFAPRRFLGVARFTLASLGGGLAFALPYALWIGWRPSRVGVLLADDYITHFISVLYVGVLVLALVGGLVAVLSGNRQSTRIASMPRLQAVVVPLLLIATAWLVAVTDVAASRADVYARQGRTYEQKGEPASAAMVYARALELQPWESRYALLRARALSDAADRRTAGEAADVAGDIEAAAMAAWEINPLEVDNAALVARVDRRLQAAPAADGTRYRDNADLLYRYALHLSPRRSTLWNEYAGFLLEIGEPSRALTAIDKALAIDNLTAANHLLRAHACLRLDRYADALAASESAIALDPQLLPAWTAKAAALTRLGRSSEAADANLRAGELAPPILP